MKLNLSDLAKIPPNVKKEIAKNLWAKQKLREAHALDYWQPWVCRHGGIHTGQMNVFQSTARRRLVFGGNRSGKSDLGAADTVHLWMGTHPYRENRTPCIIKMFSENFMYTLHKTIWPKMQKLIPPGSLASSRKNERGVITQLVNVNGSVIDFMTYEQDPKTFESFDADHAWFDEPPPQEIYEAVRRGLIDRSGTELFTMTPIRQPWIYHTLYLPAVEGKLTSTDIFDLYTECNPYISEDEIEELKEVFDEDTLKTRLFGKFKHLVGLVYPQFDRQFHVVKYFEWPREWPVWMCIDPHPKKPHAVTWIGVTPKDTKIVLDEMKLACNFETLAKEIKKRESEGRYRVVDRLVDTSIKAMDRQDQLLLLANAGIRCRFPAKHDRIDPGIEKVQEALSIREDHEGDKYASLYFRENCKGHVSEIVGYVWDEIGKPKKVKDDYMDNVRYIIDTEPRFNYSIQPARYAGGFGSYGGRR